MTRPVSPSTPARHRVPIRRLGSDILAVYERPGLRISELRGTAAGTTLQLDGELDFTSADLLPVIVLYAVEIDPPDVQLELSRLAFCDAAGLYSIIGVQEFLKAHGGRLTMRGVQPIMRRLIDILGLENVLACDAA